MKRPRLVAGEAVALLAALALFASLFTEWYGSELDGQVKAISIGGGAEAGGNAWQSLEGGAILMTLIVAFVLVAVGLRLAESKWRPAVPLNAVIAILGGLSTLFNLLRIIFPPDFGSLGGVAILPTVQLGAFLGLATSALLAYGGYRAMGERGSSFEKIANSLSRPQKKSKKRSKPGRA